MYAEGRFGTARRQHADSTPAQRSMINMATTRRSFGWIRKLPSKRYQASYTGPDLGRHSAPDTFETKVDAEGWLRDERELVNSEHWLPPKRRAAVARAAQPPTLAEYSASWL